MLLTALVVDDDRDVLESLVRMVTDCNVFDRVIACNDPKCVDDFLKESVPDVLFVDLRMKNSSISGFDIARKVREYNRHALIVIITGYPDLLYTRESVDIPIDMFATKPLSFESIRDLSLKAATAYARRVNFIRCIDSSYREIISILSTVKNLEDQIRKKLKETINDRET